jgi:nitronate monooxygenase
MLCPEAATSPAHRAAIESDAPTDETRAITGRRARGIVNRFMREHHDAAPSAYPEVHHLTQPLRRAARSSGDPDRLHLWAGQAHSRCCSIPAAALVEELAAEADDALSAAPQRPTRPLLK